MSDISTIDQKELELLTRASIYLRDKLLANGRDGALAKLLNREIDLFTNEIATRIKIEDSRKSKPRPVTAKLSTKKTLPPSS